MSEKRHIDTGGAAFPELDDAGSGLSLRNPGMSLRDYFAAQSIMPAVMIVQDRLGLSRKDTLSSVDAPALADGTAHLCYAIADAMLKARTAHA